MRSAMVSSRLDPKKVIMTAIQSRPYRPVEILAHLGGQLSDEQIKDALFELLSEKRIELASNRQILPRKSKAA